MNTLRTPRIVALILAALGLLPAVAGAQAAPPIGSDGPSWLDGALSYIVSPQEHSVFARLRSDEDRQLFMDAFWKARDPRPETPENEFRAEFNRRVEFANARWTTPEGPGWRSPEGKIYIILGADKPGLGAALGALSGQASASPAAAFALTMRILEGARDEPPAAAKPVTASYLKFMNFSNYELEEDLKADQQIKLVYGLKDLSLIASAGLAWEKGKSEKALYMFRLNGREYLLVVTPGRLPQRNQFRIEVYEQSGEQRSSLLDTEFSLPDKNTAVFGFENTEKKPYFITLRVERWVGEPAAGAAAKGGTTGGVVGGVVKAAGDRVKPPTLVREVQPVYPEEARKAGVEGVVIMEATTDTYGRVASIKVLRGIPLLDQAAIDALKQWVYEPMVIDGQPQPITFTVTMQFNLDGGKKPQVGGAVGGAVAGVAKSGRVKPPKLVREVKPVYPEEARKAGVEGVVIMEATTDTYGRVASVKVLRGIPLLDQAAIDALKQWVYDPMVVNGQPRPFVFTVTMQFKVKDQKEPEVAGVVYGVVGGVAGGVEGGVAGGVEGGVVGGVLGGVAGAGDKEFDKGAVRAAGEIKPPKLVKMVQPVYPKIAREGRVEGTVIVEAKTDEQGNVIDARVLRSIPVLDQAALDAVRQWKYEPLVVDGRPRKVVFTATVRFTVDEPQHRASDKFAEGAVKAEGAIKPPKLLKEVRAVYPEAARAAGVEGVVILSVKTDETGQVADTMVLRSIPLLDQAAIDAVRQWVYEPFVKDGKAQPVVFTVSVRFQLK